HVRRLSVAVPIVWATGWPHVSVLGYVRKHANRSSELGIRGTMTDAAGYDQCANANRHRAT
ncbi:MAG: hypothetical protein ACRERD_17500, partial [Candidatus Binatia bacterium]